MAARSWEKGWGAYASEHAWDDVGPCGAECSDDEECDVPDTPGQKLVEQMLEHLLFGRLSARECCEAMYWAALARVREAKPYALNHVLQAVTIQRN